MKLLKTYFFSALKKRFNCYPFYKKNISQKRSGTDSKHVISAPFYRMPTYLFLLKNSYTKSILLIMLMMAIGSSNAIAQKKRPGIKLGAYYFAGWGGKSVYDDGKPEHAWAKGMPTHFTRKLATEFNGRTPIWGWREDSPEIMSRQINLAAENGIAFFAYCWYFQDNKGPINVNKIENNPLHQPMKMFMNAKNNKRMQFCLLVANHAGYEIVGQEAWKQAVDFWIKNYFKHPRYLLVDGKPLIIIFSTKGADKNGLAYLQDAAHKAGFPGVLVAGCGNCKPEDGFQVQTLYNIHSKEGLGVDEIYPYKTLVDLNVAMWNKTDRPRMLYIPTITQGWDRRPWEAKNGEGLGQGVGLSPHFARGTANEFELYLRRMVDWMDANPKQITKDRIGMVYAWNEIGEGGWLVPCRDDPDGAYLKAIRHVVFDRGIKKKTKLKNRK